MIGVENHLPWRLKTDLDIFRRRTEGHAIIMGRKTFESVGRPLPRRMNIVLSRTKFADSSNLVWADSVSTAIYLADNYSILNFKKQFFVVGGENVYRALASYINKVFVTEVQCGPINGDAKFDIEFNKNDWQLFRSVSYPKSLSDECEFDVKCYLKRRKEFRSQSVEKFIRERPELARFVGPYLVGVKNSDALSLDQMKLL
ncbi:dihydrofolate reductase [Aureimonas pseudogalii]|uniref:dihydrofolate reductase n=1 Tax=Aureimonas pseudogalii TaxID=1744844 RepID=A0A7W6ECQ8_9HYPH|nr:dihydrofolate reductase [Aureimonas pseudogalii]